jgi:dephospho-CoA kinase
MKPFLIGVTGNTGGGKSTVMSHLRELGFKTVEADATAKEVIYVSKNYRILREVFGESIFDTEGKINFKQVAELFFQINSNGEEIRHFMYNYFHHDIWAEIKRKVLETNKLFVFVENSVLFEQGMAGYFNFIVCVYAKEDEAKRRIKATRGWSEERIESMIKIQIPITEKIGMSDLSLNTTNIPLSEIGNMTKGILERIGIQS